MSKRKGRYEEEAHFVAHLPIEECTRRLELLNDDDIRVEILRLSSDKVDFKAQIYEKGRVRVVGKGALRRWEGTLTRVECSVKVHEGILLWIGLSLVALLLCLLLIPTAIFAVMGLGIGTGLALGVMFVVPIIGVLMLANHFAPPDDTPQNLIRTIEEILR